MNSTPLPAIVIPTVEEAVEMYERMGGQLSRSFTVGHDPLDARNDLKESREHLYQSSNPSDEEVYSELVHQRPDYFRSSLLSFIHITVRLSGYL